MRSRSDKSFLQASAGVVFVALGGVASAQTSGVPTTPSATPSSASSVHLYEAAATQLISTTSVQQMLAISNAISARNFARQGPDSRTGDSTQRYGMAAGGLDAKWNAWGSFANDKSEYNGLSNFSADAKNTVIGVDYALSPTASVGFSAATDKVSGLIRTGNNYNSSGSTLAPYFGFQISKELALDASMGWGTTKFNDNNGSSDANRFFYGLNISYASWSGDWQLTGKGSFLHGQEKYSATTNAVDQWRIGGQLAYWANGVMPYVGVAFSDESRSTGNTATVADQPGKSATVWSLGVNFMSLQSGLTGGIVYNIESGRSDSTASNLMLNVNYRF
jgi:hypothetical protein